MRFTRSDRSAPVFEITEIDTAKRYTRRVNFVQYSKQLFPRRVQYHNDIFASFYFHAGIISEFVSEGNFHLRKETNADPQIEII